MVQNGKSALPCISSTLSLPVLKLPMLTVEPQILILADESVEDSVVQSDSRSIATLLLIRDIQVSNKQPGCSIYN